MKIKAWNIVIAWEDGTKEELIDVPEGVAKRVDKFLDELEEEFSEVEEDYLDDTVSCDGYYLSDGVYISEELQ